MSEIKPPVYTASEPGGPLSGPDVSHPALQPGVRTLSEQTLTIEVRGTFGGGQTVRLLVESPRFMHKATITPDLLGFGPKPSEQAK